MKSERIWTIFELVLLSFLFIVVIWGTSYRGVTAWNVAAAIAFFMTIGVSAYLRRPGWKSSGFRVDNLGPALRQMGLVTLTAMLVIAIAYGISGVPLPTIPSGRLFDRLLFGVFQQALILGYLLRLWQAILPNVFLAACANAFWFGLVHLPDVTLVYLAGVGEMFFSWLFFRARNVFVIGLVHGVLSLGILPLLSNSGAMFSGRIGPPELAQIARTMATRSGNADRFAICSLVLAPTQFGPGFNRKLERILRGVQSDTSVRNTLKRFLAAEERVFCVITERELGRFVDPLIRANLAVLAERYIWRDLRNRPHLYDRDPILGIFRDRVFLMSNKPSR